MSKAGNTPFLSYQGTELAREMPKVQWVTEENIPFRVLIPGPLFIEETFNEKSLTEVTGLAEREAEGLKPGDRVQFPRFGFCRIDSPQVAIFTHK